MSRESHMRALRCLAVLAATLLAAACGKAQQDQPAPPPQVGVITVHPGPIPLTRDLVGRLSATRVSDVRARVPGILLKRLYKEGTEVREGQPLFQIDPAPLQTALEAHAKRLRHRLWPYETELPREGWLDAEASTPTHAGAKVHP